MTYYELNYRSAKKISEKTANKRFAGDRDYITWYDDGTYSFIGVCYLSHIKVIEAVVEITGAYNADFDFSF